MSTAAACPGPLELGMSMDSPDQVLRALLLELQAPDAGPEHT